MEAIWGKIPPQNNWPYIQDINTLANKSKGKYQKQLPKQRDQHTPKTILTE